MQYPGLLTFALKTPTNSLQLPPTLNQYFHGLLTNNLSDNCTDRNSLQNSFDILDPLDNGCETLFQDEPTRPRFFVIESNLVIQSIRGGVCGERKSNNFTFENHYVAVIYKDNHYYIFPGEENSCIYRVGCPQKIFLTERGLGVLSILLRNSLGNDYGLIRFRLLIPKQHMSCGFGNIYNWDHASNYEIGFHMPFPVLPSSTISNDCHSSVQVVTLHDDNGPIVDVLYEGTQHDETDNESMGEESTSRYQS